MGKNSQIEFFPTFYILCEIVEIMCFGFDFGFLDSDFEFLDFWIWIFEFSELTHILSTEDWNKIFPQRSK